jgi:hypothetical protein
MISARSLLIGFTDIDPERLATCVKELGLGFYAKDRGFKGDHDEFMNLIHLNQFESVRSSIDRHNILGNIVHHSDMSSASRTTAILAKRLRTSSTRGLATTSINQNASTWTRPLPEGANPAYDASLAFLAQHSTDLLSKADRLRSKLSSAEGETRSQIEIALKKTELEARIARPETRWLHDNVTDLSTGVESGDLEALNLLAERRWRKEGRLDRLVSPAWTVVFVSSFCR